MFNRQKWPHFTLPRPQSPSTPLSFLFSTLPVSGCALLPLSDLSSPSHLFTRWNSWSGSRLKSVRPSATPPCFAYEDSESPREVTHKVKE